MNQSKTIYFDNSTVSRPSGEAISKMLTFYSDKWGTLTQPHQMGQELFPAMDEAYKEVYQLLGATSKDVVIMTSSGAEAVNQAIFSTYQDISLVEGKNHFITSLIEEAPMLMSMHRLEAHGAAVTYFKPNKQSVITTKALIEAITPRTAMMAISWASGLTGVVQPVLELAEICKLRGIRLLVDATHVLGKLMFDLSATPIDLLSFNGEQIHAPKGTGGLYVRQGIKLSSFITGGVEQGGMRAGAVNVPGVVALGVAAKQAREARDYLCSEIARLRFYFEMEIKKKIPDAKVIFEFEERLPHISCIAFPGVVNEALLFLLNQKGVYAGLGGGNQQQISYYLNSCGVTPEVAATALSFSFSRETTEEEIDRGVTLIDSCYQKLRKGSKELIAQ